MRPCNYLMSTLLRHPPVSLDEWQLAYGLTPQRNASFTTLSGEPVRPLYTLAKIDELGGMVQAVKQAYPQREIADAAYELQQEIDAGRRSVVGVNAHTEGDDNDTAMLRIDPALERKQIDRLNAVRGRRDDTAVEDSLTALKAAAASERQNLMMPLLTAARVHASEGEIIQALQDVWGDYRESPVF
jgi:methylmalonyl-CoA mutase N-terminal domain/subunit